MIIIESLVFENQKWGIVDHSIQVVNPIKYVLLTDSVFEIHYEIACTMSINTRLLWV